MTLQYVNTMSNPEKVVRQKTVDALAKGLYEEANKYGLQKHEIIRFVNTLLQLSMEAPQTQKDPSQTPVLQPAEALPVADKEISIRAFNPQSDTELLLNWLSDPEGKHFLRYRLTAQTINTEQLLNEHEHLLGIIVREEETPIGCMAFLDYDQTQQKAELRKLIGVPEMRNKGYAKRASRLWIGYGLDALGLQKIYLNALSNNMRNIRINEELGFSVEGILRNEVFLDGKHHDIIRMGLCKG